MIQAGFGRRSFVLALGGGVIGDLAGFVAAIFCRGIPVVQVPTTVMAQVDSSVGGKTGVNAPSGKNLIGAFHQPAAVLADVNTLGTLPRREFLEGFAEVIKHGCIRDAGLLEILEKHGPDLEDDLLTRIVARNVSIKARVVMNDEKETTGERALLNFGHTIGHGIEQAAGYGSLLHGEAISLGLVAALRLSVKKSGLSADEAQCVIDLLKQFELPVELPQDIVHEKILRALKTDKKFVEGKIRFVLVPRLGEALVSREVSEGEIQEAIRHLQG
jgi:3-dehydroquinate synthase